MDNNTIVEGQLFNDRYRLISEKGRGAFGEVWLAHDEQIDLDVALKIYIALDERGIEDFKSEYKNAYSLNHPNLLHAYHFDVVDRRPFLVMPYCPGSAESIIGTTDEKAIWRFIRDVASGLAYLHSKNILHRDIKPDNILADKDGNYLITDFGVSSKMKSTLRRNSTRLISSDEISGTIGYMAPELFTRNPEAVKATDIWALGASIFEIINQELPFYGQGGIMLERGAEIPELRGNWTNALKLTVEACLAKETWDRPTAAQLAEYADSWLKGDYGNVPWANAAADEKHVKPQGVNNTSLSMSQKLEICAVCKNRTFDKKTGLVCSLTGAKPAWENTCSNIVVDKNEQMRREAKKEEALQDSGIHGWTAFFLWIGIGIGMLVSTVSTFVDILKARGSFVFAYVISYDLIYLSFFLLIGISAIIAFYKQKENAVPLARAYCIMIAVDAMYVLVLYLIGMVGGSLWIVFRNLIWAAIWLTYLHFSSDIKEIFPKQSRKWHGLEVSVLVLYSVSVFVISMLCWSYFGGIQSSSAGKSTPKSSVQSAPEKKKTQPTTNMETSKPSTEQEAPAAKQSSTKSSAGSKAQQSKPSPKPVDENATRLQSALSRGDYSAVKQLADSGYSAAYLPLAKHYLQNPSTHNLAEKYALKAKNAGISGAQGILDDLTALGYYD